MKLLCLLVVLVCGLSVVASVAVEKPSDSGNAFLRLCSATEREIETDEDLRTVTNCFMYVQGLGDGVGLGHFHAQTLVKANIEEPFCGMPFDGLENRQVVSIVLKYIRNNPEKAHLATSEIFFMAMQKAFPCKGAPIRF